MFFIRSKQRCYFKYSMRGVGGKAWRGEAAGPTGKGGARLQAGHRVGGAIKHTVEKK